MAENSGWLQIPKILRCYEWAAREELIFDHFEEDKKLFKKEANNGAIINLESDVLNLLAMVWVR